jgi:hypothetical protein
MESGPPTFGLPCKVSSEERLTELKKKSKSHHLGMLRGNGSKNTQ